MKYTIEIDTETSRVTVTPSELSGDDTATIMGHVEKALRMTLNSLHDVVETRVTRIATVHLLLDLSTDADACDFLSEAFRDMPYVIDWSHVTVPSQGDPYTQIYEMPEAYEEGQFMEGQ